MKKIILYLSAFVFIISCSTYRREKFSYTPKTPWINSYKSEVFYACMKEGLRNDSLHITLKNRDLFNAYSGIDFLSIDKARELGKEIILNMPPTPYIKIDKGEEYLMKKNFISVRCLEFYASRELDSIAKKEYKEKLKEDKRLWGNK